MDDHQAPARLAHLLTTWGRMSDDVRESEEGRVLSAEVRGFGHAANFLGGWQAMERLDRATAAAGGPSGYLNKLWDGIGAWSA